LVNALALVQDAEQRLWTPEGADALAYLRDRGLADETIRRHHLGWTHETPIPIEGGARFWRISGITLPWLNGDRLTRLKIRRLGQVKGPRYVEAFRDQPLLFPGPSMVRPGEPLVIVEGEFDAILLGQELGDLAAVVTLGSASARPETAILGRMLVAPAWYIATDADDAGDKGASGWPPRAIRVRPPTPCKDWTEVFQYPINLRRWWTDRLGGIEAPKLYTWDELAQHHWGPALADPTPGVVIDRPSGRIVIVDDPEERVAIQWEGCP
jgi:hypothetical protein